LNASLGVALSGDVPDAVRSALAGVQNDLFDLGADLSVPLTDANPNRLRMSAERVQELERRIDAATARLAPLTSFVLPGGTPAAAALHLARTICRRAEIDVLRLAESEPLNPQIAIFVNRLSDLLFAVARVANDDGRKDVLWSPGGSSDARAV
jgi:cob(I)alamin adenosyltransferase